MKKYLLTGILFLWLSACNKSTETPPVVKPVNNGCYHNGKPLFVGPEGGCYFYNSNNNKEYVDRSECDCGN